MHIRKWFSWAVVFALLAVLVDAAIAGDAAKVTLQQIKQARPESVIEWAKTFLGVGTPDGQMAVELQIILLAILFVPFCQFGSFWVKWSAKMIERETSIIDYFFRQDPQRTAYAYIAALLTIGSGCFTNAFSTDSGDFVGWYNVLYNLVIVGTGGDLLINKGRAVG